MLTNSERTLLNYYRRMAELPVNFNETGSGYVYLVTSIWIPNLVKIGATRKDPVVALSTRTLPDPEVVAVWREDPPWSLERKLHAHFHEFRATGEWYCLDPDDVISTVRGWMG